MRCSSFLVPAQGFASELRLSFDLCSKQYAAKMQGAIASNMFCFDKGHVLKRHAMRKEPSDPAKTRFGGEGKLHNPPFQNGLRLFGTEVFLR